MTKYIELIAAYEVDVRFPDVSGMEHLDMLRVRSKLANHESDLTAEEQVRLLEADKALVRQARHFYNAIRKIADLETWRRDEHISSTHWWWYLDVLAQLPELPTGETIPERAVA